MLDDKQEDLPINEGWKKKKMAEEDSNQDVLSKLSDMIAAHDLTYEFSDDKRAYNKGKSEYDNIVKYIKTHKPDPNKVMTLWNNQVNNKIVNKDTRDDFYWKVSDIKKLIR